MSNSGSYYDGVGGVLGVLFNTYTRLGEQVPAARTVLFDVIDFNNMIQGGQIGKCPWHI
jgi:hypothetical protein